MEGVMTLFGVMMAIFIPISLLVMITEHYKYKNKTSLKLASLQSEVDSNNVDELVKTVADLKERIAVLESIVTDRSYNLERKITSL